MMVSGYETKLQQPFRDSIICSMLESIERREFKLLEPSLNDSEQLESGESVNFSLASNRLSDNNKESQTPKWGSNIKDFQREREEGHALLNLPGEIR